MIASTIVDDVERPIGMTSCAQDVGEGEGRVETHERVARVRSDRC